MTDANFAQTDVYPSLICNDANAEIAWLCKTFGFTCRFVVAGEGGRVDHSELTFGNAVVMVSSPKAEFNLVSPRTTGGVSQTLSLYVADPDSHYATAVAAGAKIIRPLRDEEYGARGYMAADPEGHLWYFGDYRPGAYWPAK